MSKYEEITARIVEALESADPSEWQKPWACLGMGHRNGASGHTYRGVNVIICAIAAWKGGYTSEEWFTFKQAKKASGGKGGVRKGEKGTHITFFKFIEKGVDANGDECDPKSPKCVSKKRIPLLRTYCVFNREQCDGLPAQVDVRAELTETEKVEAAEALLAESGADIRFGGDRAFYAPVEDFVQLPEADQFHTTEGYYATAFHELGHWTGHASRNDRDLSNRFGSEGYAMEELVAELTSAFVCGTLGMQGGTDATANYLASWLQVLKADQYAIFTAAREAQKAADYILPEAEEAEEAEAA